MIPEGLDKSITTAIAVGSAAIGLWAHRRELKKEKLRALDDAAKKHADTVRKEYAAQRDFGHIQNDLLQLKENLNVLSEDGDRRLDALERKFEKVSGNLEILLELFRDGSK